MRITLLLLALESLVPHYLTLDIALAKPPNFKQEKQRREDTQRKRNEAKQREQAARKEAPAPPPPKP